MTPDQVEAELADAMEKAIALGWKPARGVGRMNKCCCAIGAYSVVNDPDFLRNVFPLVEKKLQLTERETAAIFIGFDGWTLQDHDPDFFEVGRRLAERFLT